MHARHDRTVINDDGRRWEYEPWRDGEFGPRNIARTFDEVSRQLSDELARARLAVDGEPQPQPPVDVGLLTEPDLSAFVVDPTVVDDADEPFTLDDLRVVLDALDVARREAVEVAVAALQATLRGCGVLWVRGEGARPDPALPAGYLYVLDPAVVVLPLEQKGSA